MLIFQHLLNNQNRIVSRDELMEEKIGKENIKKLGFYFIPPKDIILKPNLFKKDNNK